MAKDYNALAKSILSNIGGEENVESLTHCVTRLRFKLKDTEKANTEAVSKIPGVMKVMQSGGQYQVVIGPDVNEAYDAVLANSNIKADGEAKPASKTVAKKEKKGVTAAIADLVSGIFLPFMGAFTGAGLLKGFLVLFTTLGWLDKSTTTYTILYSAGDCVFYFLPIFLGYTAGKKFGASPFMSMAIAATLVYPQIVSLQSAEAVTFFGIPVQMINYTQSVLPIIAAAYVQSKFEAALNKVVPKMIRNMVIPLADMIVLIPLTFIVVGPVTNVIANGLAKFIEAGLNLCPPVFGFLFAAAWPVMIIFGVHWGMIPIAINSMMTLGYDAILTLTVGCNFGIAAAALAVFVKTKNAELKETAGSSTVAALIGGVTEPAVYGVLLRFKLCMALVCLFNGVGGAICAIFHVVRTTQVSVNLLTLPAIYAVYGPWALAAIAISFVGSFVAVYMFGFSDKMLTEN